MLNTVDLFAGAGGLSTGFLQTKRYCIKVAFENNPAMQETYRNNHPGVEVLGDVYEADYEKIKEKYGEIDVVIGGPPCQGFSNANRQHNNAVSTNNALVKEYVRAIEELRPKAFVMENVSMLKSDVHRFYLSEKDTEMVNSGVIDTIVSRIPLLEARFYFKEAKKIVKSKKKIRKYRWQESEYIELNVIYRATKNSKKIINAMALHEKKLLKLIDEHRHIDDSDIPIADAVAFDAILSFYETGDASLLRERLEPAIMYQRMLRHAQEIIDNGLVVECYKDDNGLYAEVRSFAVFDYIKAKLGVGDNGYTINQDVLCAANFGAPQKRMRFVMMGIRKDIATETQMPKGWFTEKRYRTVRDAISDLEDVDPVYERADDEKGIKIKHPDNMSRLAKILANSRTLHNHITTNTSDVAMERFKALKQGENFHKLTSDLVSNTYTDATRTQNTIYLRLNYDEPSGTVLNVRKSMWIHPVKDRAISVREAARLQTFPDKFVFYGTKNEQYQQVGNAVPPMMAKAIASCLARQLGEDQEEE